MGQGDTFGGVFGVLDYFTASASLCKDVAFLSSLVGIGFIVFLLDIRLWIVPGISSARPCVLRHHEHGVL